MDKLLSRVYVLAGQGKIEEAARVFNNEELTECMRKAGSYEGKMPRYESIPDGQTFDTFIRAYLKILWYRVQRGTKLFVAENDNIIALYLEALNAIRYCDLVLTGVGFFKTLMAECKKDMKLYWKLPLQVLDKHADGIISELRDIYTAYKNASQDSSKGVIFSLNNLLWFYFQVNQYQQCTLLLKPIQEQLVSLLQGLEKSYIVTFYYYYGRLKIYEGQSEKAAEFLEKAFDLCSKKHLRHKIKILRLLVPFKMLCGWLPSQDLLKQYKMTEYEGLVKAVSQADLAGFDAAKKQNKRVWIKRGIYFLLDQMELIIIRRILKLVWLIGNKQTIVDSEKIRKALNLKAPQQYDLDEIECIVGNLIVQGYIRAVVFPEQKKIVFASDKAFPPLQGRGQT